MAKSFDDKVSARFGVIKREVLAEFERKFKSLQPGSAEYLMALLGLSIRTGADFARAVGQELQAEIRGLSFAEQYAGTWREGQTYSAGKLITYGGSLWLVNRDSAERPGSGPDHTLVVKAGRDAR